jgi:uncharacterized protein (TIGR03000 family)
MRRTLVLSLAALALLAAATPLVSQPPERLPAQPAARQTATIRITLPEDAKLEIDGIRTKQKGRVRTFESPPLATGKKYSYTLKATWVEDGKQVVREENVTVEAGRESVLELGPKPAVTGTTGSATGAVAGRGAPVPAAQEKKKPRRPPDVIFVPTPQEVVDKMLEVAGVKKTDILYDLGCGDGRIPVTAAKKYGCKAWGFDIDPQRIEESLKNVKENNVGNLVTIEEKDIFTLDLSKANVITLYLLPELNVKLIPQLEKLKPGSRIVSHDFDMEGVKPDKHLTMKVGEVEHEIYLWTVPLKKEKK